MKKIKQQRIKWLRHYMSSVGVGSGQKEAWKTGMYMFAESRAEFEKVKNQKKKGKYEVQKTMEKNM